MAFGTIKSRYFMNKNSARFPSQNQNEPGFSLVEIIVTAAVLAALTSIALPKLLGLIDVSYVASAKQVLIDRFTDCRRRILLSGRANPDILDSKNNEYVFSAIPPNLEIREILDATSLHQITGTNQCTSVTNQRVVANNFVAIPKQQGKFPKLFVGFNGNKLCQNGSDQQYRQTYNLGCIGVLSTTREKVALSNGQEVSNAIGYWK